MYVRDTIAAIATPPGMGGVAIIRVSGPDAAAVVTRVFRGSRPETWESHRLYAGRFVDRHGTVLDRGLGVIMRMPRSYTGEDVVELHCHGGVLVARSILAAALAAGARGAERGEFTSRAFLNGKLDLTQAESVADLISARTPLAMRVAAGQLDGALSRAVEELRQEIVGIAAHLEVAIDFSEEDAGDLDGVRLAERARGIVRTLASLSQSYAHGRILRQGLRAAIIGKPNVGKSSLLNRLLDADRAIVTATPGTTRDVIEETLDLDGLPVVLADTAGIREAADEVEMFGIERTRKEIARADLGIVVFDASRPWEAEDKIAHNAMCRKNHILVINKTDLEGRLAIPPALTSGAAVIVPVSAKMDHGIDRLKSAIVASVGTLAGDVGGVIVTRERHKQAVDAAAESAAAAADSLEQGHPPDVVAVDIMRALDHLGEIVGTTSPEVVLDRIFREFCIGK